jgi:hypothetical protein
VRAEPGGVGDGVIVQERDQVAGSGLESRVSGPAEAAARFVEIARAGL